ncbi:zinc finger homeobox protein 3 [Gadus morhua]|uniref:Zinc finger homeobox protein 3-like n=1 Tax=Gadus morhua TaxID=8049 RepID=A0A8C5B3A9_GADMO|nr:zinc finger homeobox protein 3-like [Gadus morhua]
MDRGEGGGGGGEERDAAAAAVDLHPQPLSPPLLTPGVVPEQGSSSRTSAATAPAKEPPAGPLPGPQGAGGSPAGEQTQGGAAGAGGGAGCQDQGVTMMKEEEEEEEEGSREGCLFELGTGSEEERAIVGDEGVFFKGGLLPAALRSREEEEEEEEEEGEEEDTEEATEEAISNQSQTKSKCSLLPQLSQHSSSSSAAAAPGGALHARAPALPKPPPPTPPPRSPSPKHFPGPPPSTPLPSETAAGDTEGGRGWISGFPPSFNSQRSASPSPPMGPGEAPRPAGPPPHSAAVAPGDAKAPEPNDGPPERGAGDEDGGDGGDGVLRTLSHDLSPGSLTSHMTIMHSRNSCKTLKCPKCNWHYKSQHTLQLHMREKHPETGAGCVCSGGGAGGKCVCGGGGTGGACSYCVSGKAHPRLARGETYACGYKPYRCEACDYATSSKGNLSIHMQSDKHLNNVQSGGLAGGGGGAASQSHSPEEQVYKLALPLHAPPPSQPAKLAPPPPPQQQQAHAAAAAGKRWRCDVCDYETSIARNLRIHTTSEKHTHNMLRLQRGFYLSHCRSLPPGLKHLQSAGGELPLGLCGSGPTAPDVSLATLGSTLTPSPSPSPSPPLAPPLSPGGGGLSPGVFHCLVCSSFSSDGLEPVERHLAAARSLPQAEWCSLVAGGCHCRLCAYTTPLRANFSLHCQTDRHRARYQLAAHMREGGDRAPEEAAALVAKGHPVQLRCNLCDYVTSSLEKLRGHALSGHHEASVRVYRFLQQYDGDVDGGAGQFHCLLCSHSSSSKVQLLKHSQTATHQQREGLLQLQPMGGEELAAIFTIRKSPDGVRGETSEDMETSSETNEGPPVQTKDTRNLGVEQNSRKTSGDARSGTEREKRNATPPAKRPSSGSEETKSPPSPKRPKIHQQNENQQTAQCALCQVRLPFTALRHHLTYVHSVAQDCVDKLISAVAPSVDQLETQTKMEYDYHTDFQKNNSNNNINTNGSNSPTTVENMRNTEEFRESTEAHEATPKDVTALLTPPLEEPASLPANSRPSPPSPSHHPPSSPPNSPPNEPPPPSDRHGYRFRCSRCSLAFPTQEKLQVHWQYHAMRAATECPLCARRCRSQEALQRHMQNTHSQLDSANPQSAPMPPHTAQTQLELTAVGQDVRLSPPVGEEADEEEDDDMEAEALVMEKKEVKTEERKVEGKDTQVGVSGAQENILDLGKCLQAETGLEPTPNFYMKKGSNPTMDRYLDPARPYKCTICSESFTQKTILLVHFNSVSHLHRARRALQESGPGQTHPDPPRGPDPRPYRCRLCGVGYSQSSTLDIHLRSVLHQTRARASQSAAPQIPAFGSTAPAPVNSTAAQTAVASEGTSTSIPSAKKADPAAAPPISSLISTAAEAQQALHSQAESQLAKRSAELLSSRNQILLMQQHQLAQAQAQLQQHTSLLQSQLFNPALLQHLQLGPESLLKQHFSIAPDNLLSLQQQLLLPFYLSGEMKLNPELVLKSLELNQTDSCITALMEQLNPKATRESTPHVEEKPTQRQTPTSAQSPLNESVESEGRVKPRGGGSVMTQSEPEYNIPGLKEEKGEGTIHVVKSEKQRDETNQVDCSPHKRLGLDCPPPRVPYAAANGEPLRSLLQSYGYELALQYIQSRQRHQLKINHMVPEGHKCLEEKQAYLDMRMKDYIEFKAGKAEGCEGALKGEGVNGERIDGSLEKKKEKEQETLQKEEKEKCLDCGKMFSDALVLKTHQEYLHRQLFPTAVLEKFSKEYRLQYDQLYPLAESKSEEKPADAQPTPKPDSEPEPGLEPGEQKPATDSEPNARILAPVSDLPPTTPVSTPSPSPQPQASPKHEGPLPSPSPPAISQTPSQGMGLPKLSLPLPQFPLSSLPMPPMSFPMDMPLLPSVVMQSMGLQSQPWLDSALTSEMAKLYQSQLSPTLLSNQADLGPALLAQQSQMNHMMLAQPSHHSPVLQHPQGTSTMHDPQQGKRPRTRISEEQLGVLRQHFDINSLPGDEDVIKMSSKCGLPHKVIKHWFRNTLFKERQRDKDSPYNFNNPPTTVLDEPPEEVALLQVLTEAASSISPGLPTNHSPQPQRTDPPRGEPNRGRRSSRTRFTEGQLEALQSVFEATPYPREEEYDRLSALLSLPNRVIVVWFQNARQRARKSQEKGEEDGPEGRAKVEDTQRRSRGGHKNDTEDDCGEEGLGDRQNENSMDLAYEYYTHADSPVDADSPTHRTESKHEIVNGKQKALGKMQDETAAAQAEKMHGPVLQIKTEIPEAEKQNQNKACTRVMPTPKPQPKPEPPSEKPQHTSGSSCDRTKASVPTSSPFSQDNTRPSSAPAIDRPAQSPLNPPSECETDRACMPDATTGRSAHLHPQSSLQHQSPTQFQCSFCPMSLPSPQLWQEHQTRHLLAAQSQVQLMHPGFSDRTMPYMMIHPNQTLMASQLLASAMSQMHPNPAHPMLPQMNGLHLNNTLSDHLSNSLSGLPHASMSSGKPSSKVLNDVSCEGQGGGREVEDDQRRDKRQRTTITPEQLEVLYQRYSLDSNPTRGVLESIARDVGLKRRVVQVWFQNTRARERKGQFRSTTTGTSFSLGLNHLRCLFCRALFKVKSALDAHIRSRHWAEAERAGYNLSVSNGSASQLGMSMSSLLDNAGPSASCGLSPNPGYVMSPKDRLARPLMPSHCSAIEPNSPEEEGAYEEEEEYPCDEGSSVAEQGSLSPDGIGGPSGDWGETLSQRQYQHQQQQQRQRTQMSHFQVLQLRDFYRSHRTPNRQECEALGQDLGLPHRVVQVWFQNARAKEKRARSMSSDPADREQAELSAGAGERDRA